MMTDLADILRADGLIVEEIAGWQERGHGDVNPQVIVNHHTAGSPFGRAPSLSTVLYGVPGVSGPLCNVLQTREDDGPDHFVLIAAGNSYNAGEGGWAGFTGNPSTLGLEVEHTGVEWYPDDRREWTWRFNAAVLNAYGLDSGRSCQHFEWSTAGKIDIAQGVDADFWRAKINEYQHGGAAPTPSQEDEMGLYIAFGSRLGYVGNDTVLVCGGRIIRDFGDADPFPDGVSRAGGNWSGAHPSREGIEKRYLDGEEMAELWWPSGRFSSGTPTVPLDALNTLASRLSVSVDELGRLMREGGTVGDLTADEVAVAVDESIRAAFLRAGQG